MTTISREWLSECSPVETVNLANQKFVKPCEIGFACCQPCAICTAWSFRFQAHHVLYKLLQIEYKGEKILFDCRPLQYRRAPIVGHYSTVEPRLSAITVPSCPDVVRCVNISGTSPGVDVNLLL